MRKWLLLIGAVLTLLSTGVLIIGAVSVPDLFEGPLLPQSQASSSPSPPPQPVLGWWDLLAVAALLTFIVSAIGTAATIIFTWRSDRTRREADLKITELELEVDELEQKLTRRSRRVGFTGIAPVNAPASVGGQRPADRNQASEFGVSGGSLDT